MPTPELRSKPRTVSRALETPHYHMVPKRLSANATWRRDLYTRAARDKGMQRTLRQMCSEDLLLYINLFTCTHDPRLMNRGLNPTVPFITYQYQDTAALEIGNAILNGYDLGVEKSRDMGASWIILTVMEWFWHFKSSLSFGVVSRTEDYVDKRGDDKALFWKIDYLHRFQPRWLLPEGRWLGDDDPNRKALYLRNAENGSMFAGEATTGEMFRGGRLSAMLLDEFASVKIDDGYRALSSTRDVTNCRIFNSTPKGSANAFYEVMHNTGLRKLRMHWTEHPEKRKGLYRGDKETGKIELFDDLNGTIAVPDPEKGGKDYVVFPDGYDFICDGKLRSPWYDEQFTRCTSPQEVAQELDIDYTGSDYLFFDAQFIQALRAKYARPPETVGEIDFDPTDLNPRRFTENDKGNLKLWTTFDDSMRPPPDKKYITSADVSAGTGASNSVLTIADPSNGHKIGVIRTPNLGPKEFSRLCIAVSKFFNNAFLIWDASGPTGKTFTTTVIESGYRNIYYRRAEQKVTQRISEDPGYFILGDAREFLLTEYRAALGEYKFINPSDEGLKECLQFIRTKTGGIEHLSSANSTDPNGARTAHGDEVIADALAALSILQKWENKSGQTPEIPIGSLAWRRDIRKNAKERNQQDNLGPGW